MASETFIPLTRSSPAVTQVAPSRAVMALMVASCVVVFAIFFGLLCLNAFTMHSVYPLRVFVFMTFIFMILSCFIFCRILGNTMRAAQLYAQTRNLPPNTYPRRRYSHPRSPRRRDGRVHQTAVSTSGRTPPVINIVLSPPPVNDSTVYQELPAQPPSYDSVVMSDPPPPYSSVEELPQK